MSRLSRHDYGRREFSGRLYPQREQFIYGAFRGVGLFKSFWFYHCAGVFVVFQLNEIIVANIQAHTAYAMWGAGVVLTSYAFLTAILVWRHANASDSEFWAPIAKAISFVVTMTVIYGQLMHLYGLYRLNVGPLRLLGGA